MSKGTFKYARKKSKYFLTETHNFQQHYVLISYTESHPKRGKCRQKCLYVH
jgi:hypothetical protein